MKRSVSLKEFSTTPTVSTMMMKDGGQWRQEKPSAVRSNQAMLHADERPPKAEDKPPIAPPKPSKPDEQLFGEME